MTYRPPLRERVRCLAEDALGWTAILAAFALVALWQSLQGLRERR